MKNVSNNMKSIVDLRLRHSTIAQYTRTLDNSLSNNKIQN